MPIWFSLSLLVVIVFQSGPLYRHVAAVQSLNGGQLEVHRRCPFDHLIRASLISIIANENIRLELNLKIYNFLPFGISFAALASRHSINVLSTEVDTLRALNGPRRWIGLFLPDFHLRLLLRADFVGGR
jgi:hypothetical protein